MREIKKEEMRMVEGGSASTTMINAIYRVVDFIFELGEAFGSYMRRVKEDKMCDI